MDPIVAIFTILGNLALVVSVILLLREVRENTRLTRASNSQTMVELASPFMLGLVQDRQMAELYFRSAEQLDSLDDIDRRRYRILLVWWLIFYENVYYQRRQRFLDQHAFIPWWHDLKLFVREQNLARHWAELRGLLQVEFAAEVDDLINGIERPESIITQGT